MANTKISALTALTNPTGNEELVYAYNNANGKMTLDTMKTYANTGQQAALVSGVNIKTINNTSILGSGNIDVSGGGGGGSATELAGDANIWELSEGRYVTEHDLYYKSGSVIYAGQDDSADSHRHMLFVASGDNKNAYLVLTEFNISTLTFSRMYFGKSSSSSNGDVNEIRNYKYALDIQSASTDTGDAISLSNAINQVINDAHDTSTLTISGSVYSGLTYTVYFASVQAANTYSVALGTGVTNPFNITLPSSSNKQSLITIYMTSNNTGIITGCTIAS